MIHTFHNSVVPGALRIQMSHLLKVLLFLLRVGVIKTHDELAFKCDLVVLVEQSGLGVADMQVSGHRDRKKDPRFPVFYRLSESQIAYKKLDT